MDLRKTVMDNSYKILSQSNQLIISIQQAQDVLNSYLVSPRRKLQLHFDSISADISRQILDIENIRNDKKQISLLQDIDSLLQEKNKTVRRLAGLFKSENPLAELDERINQIDESIKDTVVVTVNTDTTRIEKHTKGFWQRLKHLVNPKLEADTTIHIIHTEQESWATSRVDTSMYVDLKNKTEEASKIYSSRIQGIEKEVRELLFAEQRISLRISQLTNEFYNETILIAWMGTESSEELTQKIYNFAIVVGTLSILIILIIIFFITNDLNKGQKAHSDLAKEKQFTEELIESRHKLLLSVSHDVKTPLSSMMGYMEIWDLEEKDEEKKRQLQSARNSGEHILNMLTNLLDFSRLQQKTVSLHFSKFNLIEMTDEIIQMFKPLTEEKSLSLMFANLTPSPLYVETDRMLLKQIITNVVSNAVKYTSKGGIIIRLQYTNQLVFTVTDSGIGMDMSELKEIFKPFSRIQNNAKAEGSGFGMYVTKGLAELLKGRIEVASVKGKGTRVTIQLPVRRVDVKDLPNNSKSPAKKESQYHSILLFEDDLSLGNMVREYFSGNGFKVKLCSNPLEVNGFLQVISQFDIIFTDMQMTNITGMDILRDIRKINSRIPVWLMTANDDYTSKKAISEGFSGLIRKPIRMAELLKIVCGNYCQENNEDTKGCTLSGSVKVLPNSNNWEIFPQLSSMFGDDNRAIKDILWEFVQTSQQDTTHLRELVQKGAFAEAQLVCHKICPFLEQLDAAYLCTTLHKMDSLRGLDETAFPEWKEALTKNIEEIEEFTEMIKKKWL